VARLLVFRGDVVEHEVELGVVPVRIGRGEDNDLILDDPGKGVSRTHAELVYDAGRYILVDQHSRNGISVNGSRVERAVLRPDSAVTIGSFRLMVVDQAGDSSDRAVPMLETAAVETRSLSVDDDTHYEAAAPANETPAPPDEAPVPPNEAPVVPNEAAAVPSEASVARGAAAAPPAAGWMQTHASYLWLGGAAVVVAVAVGLTAMMRSSAGPSKADDIAGHLSRAKALLEQNDPERAISEHLGPALAIDPGNAAAVELRSQAQAAIDAQRVAQGTSGGAPVATNTIPPTQPTEAAPEASPVPAAGGTPVRERPTAALPPEQGGLERRPGESNSSLRERERAMTASYEEAKRVLARGDYATAEQLLSTIVSTAGQRYRDASATLIDARRQRRDAGLRLLAQAGEDEAAGRWDAAIEKLKQVHANDSTAAVDSDIARLTAAKVAFIANKLKEADAKFKLQTSASDAGALALYQEIIRLLPTDHPRYNEVRTRIMELQK
jgi:predicted component of type VI protein secretion system